MAVTRLLSTSQPLITARRLDAFVHLIYRQAGQGNVIESPCAARLRDREGKADGIGTPGHV